MQRHTLYSADESSARILLPRGRGLGLSRPLVMGILNATPDSFSDGGRYATPDAAVARALTMIDEGADIIDIGGESTRPGSESVALDEEIQRIAPVIKALRVESDIPISVDTCKARVAEEALRQGADMINDISALRCDLNMAAIVRDNRVPVVLMHMLGEPRNMQDNPSYDDCVFELVQFFEERLRFCRISGIDRSQIILDPGIGFGKRLQDNLAILANLQEFWKLELPLLVGASRKSFIGRLTGSDTPADGRLGGSLAAAVLAAAHGAAIVRVHDVAETVEAMKVMQAVKDSA